MKLTTGIFAAVMMAGGAWAQNPNIINNVQNKMTAVEQQKTADSDAALGIQTTPSAEASKPSAAAAAPAVKPAVIPATKPVDANQPVTATATKSVTAAVKAETTAASKSSNKLEHVNVVRHADDIQIEIGTRESLTPSVDKLSSPDRVVVQLPATAMATEQSKIHVGTAGVKGVRIGVNGKIPPTTSIVVDLEHAVTFDLSPGPSNKLVLTLHVQGAEQVAGKSAAQAPAKAQPAQIVTAKASTVPVANSKPVAVAIPVPTSKPVVAKAPTVVPASKPAATQATAKITTAVSAAPAKAQAAAPAKAQPVAPAKVTTVAAVKPAKVTIAAVTATKPAEAAPAKTTADDKLAPIGTAQDAAKAPKPEDKKWAMSGKRDPFFSPIVQQAPGGSGCSTGKKCLEIGQINVRGIVKSEAGFIAVVTNSLNKAYFLHENDPVFNGYVLRITGDSVVFQETFQDKLGKPLTREVTKRVVAPAV